jgi:hypothetical protein
VNRTRNKIGKGLVVDQFTATMVINPTVSKLNSRSLTAEDKEVLEKTLPAMNGETASSKRSDKTSTKMLS